jgi:hypothetical protein
MYVLHTECIARREFSKHFIPLMRYTCQLVQPTLLYSSSLTTRFHNVRRTCTSFSPEANETEEREVQKFLVVSVFWKNKKGQ